MKILATYWLKRLLIRPAESTYRVRWRSGKRVLCEQEGVLEQDQPANAAMIVQLDKEAHKLGLVTGLGVIEGTRS